MRLPHPSNSNLGFLADDAQELKKLIGDKLGEGEGDLIDRYFEIGLPPVTSRPAIAALFGYNEGFIWSLLNRPRRHYRRFEIPKGKETREIWAPRVSLKIIQKWLGTHFQKRWRTHESVYGFVPGRSHLSAASQHLRSDWVVSIDIENFFPSVSSSRVRCALERLGYADCFSKDAIVRLTCLGMHLTQGAPSSPVLSNIVLHDLDVKISEYANSLELIYTRYADDLVISGRTGDPKDALSNLKEITQSDGWAIAEHKTTIDRAPNRLKVHGLLVHGDRIRLTKGYRNQIRAYKHLLANGKVKPEDTARVKGHIEFAKSVDHFNKNFW